MTKLILHPAIWTGRYTRYVLAGYLRNVAMVVSVLMIIALTIDLWPQIDLITSSTTNSNWRGSWNLVRFSGLRLPGLVAPLLPFATFLGVAWAEITHTQAGERMFVWNTGRSPIQCLPAAILLGLILGPLEFTLDAYLGPAAMAIQMGERLGLDGQRLDRTRTNDVHWIATSSALLKAEIAYGPPPILHNLTVFKLDDQNRLYEIDRARTARQIANSKNWLLEDGSFWVPPQQSTDTNASPSALLSEDPGHHKMLPFAARQVTLDIPPLWLTVLGVEPQYLPISVLRALEPYDQAPLSRGLYRTRIQVLYGETLLPGAMAVLAASLAILLLPYGVEPMPVFGIIMSGYLAHAGTKACLLMGQNGYIPAGIAGWLVPVALLGATYAAFRILGYRVGRPLTASPAEP